MAEKKVFKVRRKANFGTILWPIIICSCVIGFLLVANYRDKSALSEEKPLEEEQSQEARGKEKSRTREENWDKTKKRNYVEDNSHEEINNESSDNDNVGENEEEKTLTKIIFVADEGDFGEGEDKFDSTSKETSEKDEKESQSDEGENENGRIKVVDAEIEDDKIIEELKTKISTNAPKQYHQIERSVNSLKNSIKDWDEGRLEHQKNLFTNMKEKLKVKLQKQNVKNDKEWLSQTEEQLLEMGLKIKEIENKLSELPND